MATNREIIESLYSSIGRVGDPEGVNYWLNRLNSGESASNVADAFNASANYVMQQDQRAPYYTSASPLPYYSGLNDIYSRIMAQMAQERPYYSAYGADFTGGYNPNLYRPFSSASSQTGGGGLISGGTSGQGGGAGGAAGGGAVGGGLIGGGAGGGAYYYDGNNAGLFSGAGPGGEGPGAGVGPSFGDSNSLSGGLIGSIVGSQAPAPVSDAGSMTGDAFSISDAAISGTSAEAPGSISEAETAGTSADAPGSLGSLGIGIGDGGAPVSDAGSMTGDSFSVGFGDAGDGGGGGGGGGKIICTKLHELGKMPTEIYEADQAFGAMLVAQEPQTYHGYACWAQHVVRWMSRDDLFGKFVVAAAYSIATPWSRAMAHEMGVNVKAGWFGRLLLKQGLKVCRFIGNMKQDRSVKNV